MNLRWFFNRLRAMEPAEIGHRLLETGKRWTARRRLEGWDRYVTHVPAQLPKGLTDWLMDEAERDRQAVKHTAKSLLAGNYSALGANWPQRSPEMLFPAWLWRLDPITGGLWPGPEHYCFDISYRHERHLGDVKYVWEISRLQFLQPLAASARAGDLPALAAVETAIGSWYDANPPFRGLAWASGIEVALRSISLLVVVALLDEQLSPATRRKVGAMLSASLLWLVRYPSSYSSANNHLVAEAAGALLITMAMPDLFGAAKIKARSRLILEHEAEVQILPDGVPAEQSPTYGAFTAELLHFCELAARHDGDPLARIVQSRLQQFATFVAWMAESGRVPSIGDDDEGRVIAVLPSTSSYVVTIAGRLPRVAAPRGAHSFEVGGYSVVRESRDGHDWHLAFDHGPLGYLSIAAHGHADSLALTLSLDGEELLVDPGTYLYHSGGAWRDWFRGTRAHNTLNVGRQDQSVMSGPFNWSQRAASRLVSTMPPPTWRLVGSHDGYRKRFGITHWRTVEPIAGGVLVRDEIDGEADTELVYQLAPGYRAEISGDAVILTRSGAVVARLTFAPVGDLAIAFGEDRLDGGWVSPRFGIRIPAWRISWLGRLTRAGVSTTISVAGRTG